MNHGKRTFIASFLVVPIALYVFLVLSPYAQAFYISLTDWQGMSPNYNFVGLRNFQELFRDPIFWTALRNNLLLLVSVTVVTMSLALFFAAMISFGGTGLRRRAGVVRGAPGAAFYRVVFFLPSVLSVAIVAVLWQFVFEPRNGLLNGTLSVLGLDALRQVWLGEQHTALAAVATVTVWVNVGFFVVIFTAAMASIPTELFEAATLDGASLFQMFWRVTLPLIWDAVQVGVIFLAIGALDAFALVQIMTVGPGGPDNATQVIALYLYENAFSYGKFGYASAIGVTLFLITLIFTAVTFRLSRRDRVEY